jgi:hypothetical protein
MKQLCIGLCSLVLLLGACSDAEYQDSDGGAITLDQLADEYARTYCRTLTECVIPGGENKAVAVMARNGGDCEALFGEQIRQGGIIEDVEGGLVAYDGKKARECLDAILDQCSLGGAYIPACEETFSGKIQEGETCALEGRCALGLYCNSSASDRCEWTCTVLPVAGESCADSYECAGDGDRQAYCDFNDETCRLVEVSERADVGGACSDGGADGAIQNCARGLWCDQGGTCRAPIALGGVCTDNDDYCEGDALCIEGECRPLTVVNQAGGECSNTFEGELRVCNWLRDLQCKDGKCAPVDTRRPAAAGESCQDADCESGLYCAYTEDDTQVCVAPAADGEPCDYDNYECQSGYCSPDRICEAELVCE